MTDNNLVIRSEEEAYNWLGDYLKGNAQAEGIQLVGWPVMTVRLTGDKFDQSITPTVMKGIIELQSAILRSYALSKYGAPNTRKLTAEEKNQLEFKVKVEKGSSVLEINLQELLTSIATQAVGKMDPTTIAVTVISLGAIWAGKSAFNAWLDHRKEIRSGEAKNISDREHLEAMKFMSAEETKRSQILSDVIKQNADLDNAERYAQDARVELLKSFSSADSAEIDGSIIEPGIAQELVKNARRKSEEVRLDGLYKILINNASDVTAFKVRVRNKDTGAEFDAVVQDDTLTQQFKSILQEAEWNRSYVDLRINARSLEGSIRNAVIVHVERAKPEEQ